MKTLKFLLTEEEANLVLSALSKGSFEVVAKLINNIQNQGMQQLAPKPKKEKVDAKAV